MPKIVVLDGYVANPGDLSWEGIRELGELEIYDRTTDSNLIERARTAEIIITNKCVFNEDVINALPSLKCICLLATGYNNIDTIATKKRGIVVCNAVGYSTFSVAQHVFALLLELTNHVGLHSQSTRNNEWCTSSDWSYSKKTLTELAGKTLGIYGLGNIGSKVGQIGLAFGMKVIATRKNPNKPTSASIELVTTDRLLKESDVLTLHVPLNSDSKHLINASTLAMMKSTALLINTGRGGLINEKDLKKALVSKSIAGAGLDVLSQEPAPSQHILLDAPNCIITPHQAWASLESRARLLKIVAGNIKAYLDDKPQNVVNA